MRELSRRHRRRHHRRRRRRRRCRHGHSRNYTSTANETSLATLPSDRHFVAMAADTAGTGTEEEAQTQTPTGSRSGGRWHCSRRPQQLHHQQRHRDDEQSLELLHF